MPYFSLIFKRKKWWIFCKTMWKWPVQGSQRQKAGIFPNCKETCVWVNWNIIYLFVAKKCLQEGQLVLTMPPELFFVIQNLTIIMQNQFFSCPLQTWFEPNLQHNKIDMSKNEVEAIFAAGHHARNECLQQNWPGSYWSVKWVKHDSNLKQIRFWLGLLCMQKHRGSTWYTYLILVSKEV